MPAAASPALSSGPETGPRLSGSAPRSYWVRNPGRICLLGHSQIPRPTFSHAHPRRGGCAQLPEQRDTAGAQRRGRAERCGPTAPRELLPCSQRIKTQINAPPPRERLRPPPGAFQHALAQRGAARALGLGRRKSQRDFGPHTGTPNGSVPASGRGTALRAQVTSVTIPFLSRDSGDRGFPQHRSWSREAEGLRPRGIPRSSNRPKT